MTYWISGLKLSILKNLLQNFSQNKVGKEVLKNKKNSNGV